ncbi:MAG: Uncharacterised protein [Hyphomonas sp. TMED17]|nr:MAG: Uncharacterised protein [Hyphomonas sp. TMED17]
MIVVILFIGECIAHLVIKCPIVLAGGSAKRYGLYVAGFFANTNFGVYLIQRHRCSTGRNDAPIFGLFGIVEISEFKFVANFVIDVIIYQGAKI